MEFLLSDFFKKIKIMKYILYIDSPQVNSAIRIDNFVIK